jgi:hypothetical protein
MKIGIPQAFALIYSGKSQPVFELKIKLGTPQAFA